MIVDKFIALSALPHLPQAGAHVGGPFSALTFFCAPGGAEKDSKPLAETLSEEQG